MTLGRRHIVYLEYDIVPSTSDLCVASIFSGSGPLPIISGTFNEDTSKGQMRTYKCTEKYKNKWGSFNVNNGSQICSPAAILRPRMNWKMVKKPETETGDGFFAPSFGFLIQQRPFHPRLLFVCFLPLLLPVAFTSHFYLHYPTNVARWCQVLNPHLRWVFQSSKRHSR